MFFFNFFFYYVHYRGQSAAKFNKIHLAYSGEIQVWMIGPQAGRDFRGIRLDYIDYIRFIIIQCFRRVLVCGWSGPSQAGTLGGS